MKEINFKKFFACVALIIFGFILVGSSLFTSVRNNEYNGKSVATVTNVSKTLKTDANGESQTVYSEYVSYEIDSIRYENVKLRECDPDTAVGNKMFIEYDVNNPSVIKEAKTDKPFFVRIFGWMFIFFGIGSTIVFFSKNILES